MRNFVVLEHHALRSDLHALLAALLHELDRVSGPDFGRDGSSVLRVECDGARFRVTTFAIERVASEALRRETSETAIFHCVRDEVVCVHRRFRCGSRAEHHPARHPAREWSAHCRFFRRERALKLPVVRERLGVAWVEKPAELLIEDATREDFRARVGQVHRRTFDELHVSRESLEDVASFARGDRRRIVNFVIAVSDESVLFARKVHFLAVARALDEKLVADFVFLTKLSICVVHIVRDHFHVDAARLVQLD